MSIDTLSPSAPKSPKNRYVSDFTDLMKTVRDSGLLRRRHAYYWARFTGLTLALAGLFVAVALLGDSWWQLGVAVLLAATLGQAMFLGHDAAHSQIFGSKRWNDWSSLVIANLYAGMSYGWWNHKHSRHHAKPNQVDADPDIKSGVLVFQTDDLTKARTGIKGWFAARQGWFFFPLLLLEGVNLHASGVKTIFGKAKINRRWVEMSFVTLRILGYLGLVFWAMPAGLAFLFLSIQLGLFGLYMGAVFAPNHKGMPVAPKNSKIDFLRRQVLMSRNVKGGRITDFLMGGLNYQIEHHLFPSMPRPHLRKVQPIVREFCASKNIPYSETSVLGSYNIVIKYLNEVGLRARDPFDCPLASELRSFQN